MSLRQNQNFEFWKEVEVSLRSTAFTCSHDRLVEADRATVSQVYTLWCLGIRDLCGDSRLRSNQALRAWIFQVGKVAIEDVVDTLKECASACRDYNRDMGPVLDFETFKQSLRSERKCINLVLRPIADLVEVFLRECQSTMLQCLLTCLEFPCRMTIRQLPSLLRKEQETYMNLEAEMKTWQYPPDLLAEMEDEVRASFLDWPGFTFRPMHGPGTVSDVEGRDATAKYHHLLEFGLPPRLHHYFCQTKVWHPLVNMRVVDKDARCRVLFVPKGASTKRVISSETVANQWFQQALLRDLADYLPRCPLRITMRDQTRNQELAQEGSLNRTYGTIDLSSASDTVTYPLVKALFEHTPLWMEMWSSRTRYAACGADIVSLSKFAPMGSAICFPVESIIFASVVRVAQKHKGVHNTFVVYGDDIICHGSVFDEVCSILEQLHFRVNEKKTFHPASPFKESCGKEYYYGFDVTPFRIPRFFQGWTNAGQLRQSPQLLAGWVSLCNRLYDSGLLLPRSYLVWRLLQLCPSVPFSVRSDYVAIRSPFASNYHLKERWESETSSLTRMSRNLCRGRLVKGVTLFAKVSPGDDDVRYQMLLEEYYYTSRQALLAPEDLIHLVAGPSQLVARDRWIPSQDLIDYVDDNPKYGFLSGAMKTPADTEFCSVSADGSEWRLRVR